MKKKYTLSLLLIILVCLLSLTGCGQKTVTGKLEYTNGVIDTDLNVEADSPILVRTVEMVQYTKDDNDQAKLVFANYKLDSFGEYENPDFPEDIQSKVFFGDISINGNKLTQQEANSLAYSNQDDLVPLTELPTDTCEKYGLIYKDGAYVTASDDWQVGEIRVTYYTLNIDTNKDYTLLTHN